MPRLARAEGDDTRRRFPADGKPQQRVGFDQCRGRPVERAFARDPRLDSIRGFVQDSGEGRWTVQESLDQDVPAPIITLSLMRRFESRQEESFAARVQAALRNEFGGHAVETVTETQA